MSTVQISAHLDFVGLVGEVAYREQPGIEPVLVECSLHRARVAVGRPGETESVVGVPGADMLQAVQVVEDSAGRLEERGLLVEGRAVVFSSFAWSQHVLDHRGTRVGPETKKVSTGLDPWIVCGETGHDLQFTLVDERLVTA